MNCGRHDGEICEDRIVAFFRSVSLRSSESYFMFNDIFLCQHFDKRIGPVLKGFIGTSRCIVSYSKSIGLRYSRSNYNIYNFGPKTNDEFKSLVATKDGRLQMKSQDRLCIVIVISLSRRHFQNYKNGNEM